MTDNDNLDFRGYIDTCMRPSNTEDALGILRDASKLGYKALVFEYDEFVDMSAVARAADERGIRIFWRITVRAGDRKSIKKALGSRPSRVSLVALEPLSYEAARYAARSRSIHILTIGPGMEKYIDRSTLTLFEQRGWGLAEIQLTGLSDLLVDPPARAEQRLKHVFVAMRKAAGYGIPASVASCAETRWDLVHPQHVAGIASLAGVPPEVSVRWLTVDPARMLSVALRVPRSREI